MSGDRGVFFAHVMKTGGTSAGRLMRRWAGSRSTYPDGPGTGVDFYLAKVTWSRPLELLATEGGPRSYYWAHLPAWVADEVAPDHLHVTFLREPVERAISHLRHIARQLEQRAPERAPIPLDAIYDDPTWRDRLTDYQVRFLGSTREGSEAAAAGPPGGSRGRPVGVEVAPLAPFIWTAVQHRSAVEDGALERAVARLDRFDVVGLTEDLDAGLARVAEILGRPPPASTHLNRGGSTQEVSDALRDRLGEDHQLDQQLYEHARARAGAGI